MARPFPKVRTAHRFSHGRATLRLRRPAQSLPSETYPLAPIGHNSMPEGESEPQWLKERPMSDDWNHNQQHHEHTQDNWQGDQTGQVPDAYQPTENHEMASEAPSEASRIEAIETALADLKANFEALKAGLPAAVIHPVGDVHADAVEHAPAAAGDKLAAIEAELHGLRDMIVSIGSDVKSHADLHAETRAIVDEQHQLMRGLNYIITTAIGTLTSVAKQPK